MSSSQALSPSSLNWFHPNQCCPGYCWADSDGGGVHDLDWAAKQALEGVFAELDGARLRAVQAAEASAEAARALHGRIEEFVTRAEAGADAWGACSHEWVRLSELRALLNATGPAEAQSSLVAA